MSGISPSIGHNNGPAFDRGVRFRTVAWSKARKGLLGETLPIEVIRMRVRRATELGLPYRSYASIRASTGRDVLGFLFSSNALRLIRAGDALPAPCADRLARIKATRIAAVHRPLEPETIATLAGIDRAGRAPAPLAGWGRQSAALDALFEDTKLPRDSVVLIHDAPFEVEWVAAGKLAGFIPAPAFFSA